MPTTAWSKDVAGPYLAAKQAEMRGDVAAAAQYYGRALASDSRNPVLIERTMLNKIAAGDVAAGIALARRLESIYPGHHLGVLALAVDNLRRNKIADARKLLEQTTDGKGPFVGQIIDAWAAFAMGDTDDARKILHDLEKSKDSGRPGQVIAAYHLGLIEAASGNDEAAVKTFAKAAALSEDSILRLVEMQAAALARLGRKDEALGVIDAQNLGFYGDARLKTLRVQIAADQKPALAIKTGVQGVAEVLYGVSGLIANGRSRLIALSYARLARYLEPGLSEAELLIARILDEGGQYNLAIDAYGKIPANAPEALVARIGQADAMASSGRLDDAIAAMKQVVSDFPNTIEAHTALGDLLRQKNQFAEAGLAYDNAIALIDTVETYHWVLFYQRGIVHERSKQWDRAEADFNDALALVPDQPLVLNYLGYSWVEMGRNLDKAEEMIKKAVELRPQDGYIVDSLGWVQYRRGDFSKAVVNLAEAVELRPVDPVINDHYGDALWMAGRKNEARFQWHRALSFEPEEEAIPRIQRKLEVGLDTVLKEEAAAGKPAIIGREQNRLPVSDGG